MSIEFVEPEPRAAPVPVAAAPRAAAWPGRVLAGVTLLAVVLAAVGSRLTLYVVERTASIIDFDGTVTIAVRLPVDAFGRADRVPLPSVGAVAPSGDPVLLAAPEGVGYGSWWTGLAAALLVLAVAAFVLPRSRVPAAFVAAAGGVLLGSVGAAWLAIRTVDRDSMPQIRYVAEPALGLWLLAAAGVLALLGGLLAAARPSVRRLLPRRR